MNDKPWTRAREVCRVLEYQKGRARAVLKKYVSIGNKQHKYELVGRAAAAHPVDWTKDSQKCHIYINEEGMYELVFSSQQLKSNDFKKHCCNVLFPYVRKQLTEKMVDDHQQAITDRDNQIQAIQYENVALQAQRDVYQTQLQQCEDTITHLRARYEDHARDPGKDNIIIIARKHTISTSYKYHDLPYYVCRIQRRKRYEKLRWLNRHFPDHEVIVKIDTPNNIHAFNRFQREGHVERRYNHFRLIDLT